MAKKVIAIKKVFFVFKRFSNLSDFAYVAKNKTLFPDALYICILFSKGTVEAGSPVSPEFARRASPGRMSVKQMGDHTGCPHAE